MEEEPSQKHLRAKKLSGRQIKKVHKLRNDVEQGLKADARRDRTHGPCTSCKPVLEKLQPVFESFVRSDLELKCYLNLENPTRLTVTILLLRMSGYEVICSMDLVIIATVKRV